MGQVLGRLELWEKGRGIVELVEEARAKVDSPLLS